MVFQAKRIPHQAYASIRKKSWHFLPGQSETLLKTILRILKLILLRSFLPLQENLEYLHSKIIEWIIHDQTKNYLSDSNDLYKYESGFRKFHSIGTCLLYLHDKITKVSILVSWPEWPLLIYKKRSIQLTTTF